MDCSHWYVEEIHWNFPFNCEIKTSFTERKAVTIISDSWNFLSLKKTLAQFLRQLCLLLATQHDEVYLCSNCGLGTWVHRLWWRATVLSLACCYIKRVVGSVKEFFDFSLIWPFSGIWNFRPLFLPLPVSLHYSTEKGTFVLQERKVLFQHETFTTC